MDAKEARRTALSVTEGAMKTQYHDIQNSIDKAVKEGKMQTHYYKSILEGVRLKLEAEGYDLNTFDGGQMDGVTVTISW